MVQVGKELKALQLHNMQSVQFPFYKCIAPICNKSYFILYRPYSEPYEEELCNSGKEELPHHNLAMRTAKRCTPRDGLKAE